MFGDPPPWAPATPPDMSAATDLELAVTGAISTVPPFDVHHPAWALPIARTAIDAIDQHPPADVPPIEVAAYDHLEQVTAQRDALVGLCVELAINGCDGITGGCLTDAPAEPWDWCDSCTIAHRLHTLDLWDCPFILPGGARCQHRPGHTGDHFHLQDDTVVSTPPGGLGPTP